MNKGSKVRHFSDADELTGEFHRKLSENSSSRNLRCLTLCRFDDARLQVTQQHCIIGASSALDRTSLCGLSALVFTSVN